MRTKYSIILLSKISLLLVALLLGGLAFSSCSAGMSAVPRGWSGGTVAGDTLFIGSMGGNVVSLNTTDGSRLWAAPLESPVSGGGGFGCAPASTTVAVYGTPVVIGDLVYIGGYINLPNAPGGLIYAFSSGRDEPTWLYPRQGVLGGPIVGGLVASQGRVYFGSVDGKVYALEADGLFEEWVFETEDKIWSTPAIAGDTLFVGSFDKKLYALDAVDGNKKWEFKTEGTIVSTPVVYNNTVYVGSFDRHLYAVDATDGSQRWKFMAENWFWAKPVIYNDAVYAANLDGKVYALDAQSGNKLAEFDLGSPVSSSLVLAGDSVIVVTEDGVVYALDAGTTQQKKLVNLGEKVYAPLVASQGKVYIHTINDVLYEVDTRSGAKRELNIK
ncbi:PQQ-binding-like beta-propeller repeat protein [Chloroflexota bacterium]